MSAYDLETVIEKWERAELTAEQAMGQLMLLLQGLAGRIGQIEKDQAQTRLESRQPKETEAPLRGPGEKKRPPRF